MSSLTLFALHKCIRDRSLRAYPQKVRLPKHKEWLAFHSPLLLFCFVILFLSQFSSLISSRLNSFFTVQSLLPFFLASFFSSITLLKLLLLILFFPSSLPLLFSDTSHSFTSSYIPSSLPLLHFSSYLELWRCTSLASNERHYENVLAKQNRLRTPNLRLTKLLQIR